VAIDIHGLDPPCSNAISGPGKFADEWSVFDETRDDNALTGLHVGADGNGELSQSTEALLFVQPALRLVIGSWCGGEELNLHVLADTSS
jgi:hypothetical protein